MHSLPNSTLINMVDIPTGKLFAGYAVSADGSSLIFPMAVFDDLSLAEADSKTGDSRKVIYEFIKLFHNAYQTIPEADRPTQIQSSEGIPTGQSPGEIRKSYTFSFDLDISGVDVAGEPV